MATTTAKYQFKKPGENDFYNIQDQNDNWDKADEALNDIQTQVKRNCRDMDAALTAAGWVGTGPYTQTVTVEGILETDRPIIECVIDAETKAEKTAMLKAWGMVDKITSGTGKITAICKFEKPTVDLPLVIKGA